MAGMVRHHWRGVHKLQHWLSGEHNASTLVVLAALAPALFFTLAGNILWTYVLPGLPFVAEPRLSESALRFYELVPPNIARERHVGGVESDGRTMTVATAQPRSPEPPRSAGGASLKAKYIQTMQAMATAL